MLLPGALHFLLNLSYNELRYQRWFIRSEHAYGIISAYPSPLRSTTRQRHAGSSSGSDSETGDDNGQEAGAIGPRLTPATMVDRLSGQRQRRAPESDCRAPPLPSASLPVPQTRAPPMAGETKAASRDLENEERDRGNKKFGRGEFEEAIKSYTRWVFARSGCSAASA